MAISACTGRKLAPRQSAVLLKAVVLPILNRLLVISHPVNAWHAGRLPHKATPNLFEMSGTGMYRCLSPWPACIVDEKRKYIHSTYKLGQGLRTFGLTDSLPETLACVRQYAFTLYGLKKTAKGQPCTSLDELRCILASTTCLPLRMLLNSMFNGLCTKLVYGVTVMSPNPFCGIQLGRVGC